jgi:RNA exonuclease 1
MTDDEIYALMLRYAVDPDQLRRLGFPTESELHPGKAYIYRDPEFGCRFEEDHVLGGERSELDEAEMLAQNLHTLANTPKLPSTSASSPDLQSQDDVQCQLFPARVCESSSRLVLSASAKEFVPGALRHSRRCSQASEEREDAKDVAALTPTSGSPESKEDYDFPPKRCVRCSQAFYISPAGEYLTQEACVYHWGKLRSRRYKRPAMFSCCGAKAEAKGCVKAEYHVWTGLSSEPGMHGPLDDFVRTRSRSKRSQKIVGAPPPQGVAASPNNILSLDGEMAFTPHGLELIKLTVVGLDGRLVYDTLVQPDNFIVDYNTRFSGLCERDLEKGPTKSLREVQNDLMGFVNSNSILIGHGLDNDLRALKLIHSTIIDTSIVFPHYFGLPYRRSLKSLVKSYLKRDIQKADWGHDSFEDALACAELMLWKVRKDLGVKSPHKDSSEQLDPS